MDDWRAKLENLSQDLRSKERAEADQKAATLMTFRKALSALEPVLKTATEFGDAFGVDCAWEISRFDDRYPYLRFKILKPVLAYEVLCKDGVLHESLKDGEGPAKANTTTMQALAPREFEKRITAWVQAAANSNRRVPGGKGRK